MAAEKQVMVVGVDDSEHSLYALGWTLDHFFVPFASNSPFNLVVVHAKPTAASAVGAAEVLPFVDADLKRIAARVIEKTKEICMNFSIIVYDWGYGSEIDKETFSGLRIRVDDVIYEVGEGDARNVLCETVEKHHASILVVGSHGYGAIKRAVLGKEDMVGSTKATTDPHRQQYHHQLMDGDADHHHHLHHASDEDDPSSSVVSCSICLDTISDNGGRSRAKLQCGHEFHLDCIGSAFNMKGAMQCPNCRKVEKGQWLYANGSTCTLHEMSMDDWISDEDLYDLSYSEMDNNMVFNLANLHWEMAVFVGANTMLSLVLMVQKTLPKGLVAAVPVQGSVGLDPDCKPYRVHWCPFGDLARVGSSYEEVESPSTTWTASCCIICAHSYVAYVGPTPPNSSRSNDSSIDDSNFNHLWNGPSGRHEIFSTQAVPAINIQYHSWGRRSPPFSISGRHINVVDPASVPLMFRSSYGESDTRTRSTSFPHPVVFGHGSGPTVGSSFVSAIIPRHPGSSAQTHERIQISHAFHHRQHSSNSPGIPPPIIHGVGRFDSPRGLRTLVPAPRQHDHSGGFMIIPLSSSVQNLQETENPLPNHFHTWEREHLPHLQHASFDRDLGWGSFHQSTGGPTPGNRSSSFWHRHLS
ncbi:hypothetical protein GH714_037516 [Hevea brasiliensis]|uniref:RING-type domain-containing protein n=1 Tax=Hevea brasiliensis TaxID=3981 RepID=A0A6A6MRT0_HEVBR|nr:hypothetical protein GH714_037516 [Hevea brasiliensis]